MLHAVLTEEAHGTLDEGLKAHYRKTEDGSFRLDVGSVGGFELDDVSGLKTALGKERQRAELLDRDVKALKEKFGDLDPEAARSALKTLEEMGGLDGNEKLQKELEAKTAAMEKKFADDRVRLEAGWTKTAGEYEERNASLTAHLTHEMISSKALQAITSAGGSPKLLLPVVKGHCRVEQVDSDDSVKFVVRVYDDNGVPAITLQQGKSGPMTIEEFVTELKQSKDYAPAFEGTAASGSGGGRTGPARGAGGKTVINRHDLDAVSANIEKIASGEVVLSE